MKPPFGVPTPEAYALLAKAGKYRPAAQAEAELAAWIAQPAADPSVLGNDLAAPVFAKYLALPVGLESFRRATGVNWQMTGSGSACFAFVSDGFDHARLRADVRRAWGPEPGWKRPLFRLSFGFTVGRGVAKLRVTITHGKPQEEASSEDEQAQAPQALEGKSP